MGLVMRVAVVAAVFCAGCVVLAPRADSGPGIAALQDAYLIAHGMATSYVERPDANPAVVQELIRLDSRAAASVRNHDPDATAEAVAALTNYAASQSGAQQQATSTP